MQIPAQVKPAVWGAAGGAVAMLAAPFEHRLGRGQDGRFASRQGHGDHPQVLEPADAGHIRRLFERLSPRSRYHRFFSHKSYEASRPVQVFYAIFGAMAAENSILW